jgi:hypothetical protein
MNYWGQAPRPPTTWKLKDALLGASPQAPNNFEVERAVQLLNNGQKRGRQGTERERKGDDRGLHKQEKETTGD